MIKNLHLLLLVLLLLPVSLYGFCNFVCYWWTLKVQYKSWGIRVRWVMWIEMRMKMKCKQYHSMMTVIDIILYFNNIYTIENDAYFVLFALHEPRNSSRNFVEFSVCCVWVFTKFILYHICNKHCHTHYLILDNHNTVSKMVARLYGLFVTMNEIEWYRSGYQWNQNLMLY